MHLVIVSTLWMMMVMTVYYVATRPIMGHDDDDDAHMLSMGCFPILMLICTNCRTPASSKKNMETHW